VNEQTDPSNCGGCGVACGGTCALGRCLVTLASATTATSIAVDATAVYWTTQSTGQAADGAVMKVPVGGGPPEVLASSQIRPATIAVDGTSVYWVSGDGLGDSNLMKVSRVGGAAPVTLINYYTPLAALAVDATSVYWTDSVNGNARPNQPSGGRVSRMPSGGGAVQRLVEGSPLTLGPLAVDATSVYWLGSPASPTNFTNVLQKMPLQGGASVTLATYQDSGPGFTVAALPLPVVPGQTARDVYWVVSPPSPSAPAQPVNNLLSVPAGGGSISTLATGGNGLAVDATSIYWTTGSTVMSMPMGGGTPVTLASVGGGGIAVDATSVYWIGSSSILKLTLK
jgi:hypothetical protein